MGIDELTKLRTRFTPVAPEALDHLNALGTHSVPVVRPEQAHDGFEHLTLRLWEEARQRCMGVMTRIRRKPTSTYPPTVDAMVAPGGWRVEQIQLYASPSWSARSFLRVQDVPCFVAYLPERRRGRPARRPGPRASREQR